MSYSFTSAAATSSWVESGFDAQQNTSAPPALSVRSRLAVSQVMCRHAPRRCPLSVSSLEKRSRIRRRTGIWRSAHSIRLKPADARPRSWTSYSCTACAAGRALDTGFLLVAVDGIGVVSPEFTAEVTLQLRAGASRKHFAALLSCRCAPTETTRRGACDRNARKRQSSDRWAVSSQACG